MTKRQRLSIYKKALKIFEEFKETPLNNDMFDRVCFGVCQILSKIQDNNYIEDYPELVSLKPKGKRIQQYWWTPYKTIGITKRIEVLKKCIELCSASQKKST